VPVSGPLDDYLTSGEGRLLQVQSGVCVSARRIDLRSVDESVRRIRLIMCRLFGMSSGSDRVRATFWLLDAPDSLSVQSHREPDGTGLGWFDADGRPHINKQPIAAYDDSDFAREAREVASNVFIAHIRFASTGSLDLKNTHPFEQQGRLFAHNGVIGDLPALEAHLGDSIGLVQGQTDSERLFALITREIDHHGGDVQAGIGAACGWVAENLPVFAINLVLAGADGIWALRYPQTHDLFVLERSPGSELSHRSHLGTHVSSEQGSSQPLVVLASERMDDDPAWRLLDSGELLHVSPTLTVSKRRLLNGPPAKPLRIEDLSAKARASQTPASSHG
jgi:predicted glutamine amidotransferase